MQKPKMEITSLTLTSPRVTKEERILILADLHQQPCDAYLDCWCSLDPTLILIPGDFIEASDHRRYRATRSKTYELLEQLPRLAPVYYSLGNHETGKTGRRAPLGEGVQESVPLSEKAQMIADELTRRDITVLHNQYVQHTSLCIGGLTSAAGGVIATDWLSDMQSQEGFRLLLCHHPEYYERYVKRFALDLTVSGHAHGGQWQFFGRGVYAPGQGLFPRYTNGFYDEQRLLVSRGLADRYHIPRLGNPKQTVLLHLLPGEA